MCAHLHWTWDYLHHGISWAIVQRIMSDLPSYDYKNKDDEDNVKLTRENSEDIKNYINSLT